MGMIMGQQRVFGAWWGSVSIGEQTPSVSAWSGGVWVVKHCRFLAVMLGPKTRFSYKWQVEGVLVLKVYVPKNKKLRIEII